METLAEIPRLHAEAGVTRVVVALGGNALLRRGEAADAEHQRTNIAIAAHAIAPLAAEHELVVTHGNGPQVGLLALQALAYEAVPPYPLDVLGAESEGMIGYLLEQALETELPDRRVATLLTQTVVSSRDPAFLAPTKPIGPMYQEDEARRLSAERGWSIAPDAAGFRRVVPSPEPERIVELATIRLLLDAGVMVICGGGGGIPVVADPDGALHGVEAVVDKDLAAAELAVGLNADLLAIVTDVPGVVRGFGRPGARVIEVADPEALRALELASGSMGPKAEACARFVENTGKRAVICDARGLRSAVRGVGGTQVLTGAPAAPSAISSSTTPAS
jgi:carbamate kinase